jgi:hypothetical protein
MEKVHIVKETKTDEKYLYLPVDNSAYRIRWVDCSARLAEASDNQRKRFEVSPSGYGIHWPEIDEDLAITPLMQIAEKRTNYGTT